MNAVTAIASGDAKIPGSRAGTSGSHNGNVLAVFEKIFPKDATKTLARLLGLSYGGARKKLDGDRALSLDEFAILLHTPAGFSYLTAVMADSQVRWWRICKPLMDVAEIETMQIKARRKLARVVQGAIDADTDLTAARARAEALLVHDEDFYRGHADALRSLAGVPDRTLAPAGKRRR